MLIITVCISAKLIVYFIMKLGLIQQSLKRQTRAETFSRFLHIIRHLETKTIHNRF